MAGEGETADLGCAAVEDMEQDPLAIFDADGFSMAELMTVDSECSVADLKAFWPIGMGLFGFLLHGAELGDGGIGEEIHGHVAAAHEIGLKFFEDEEYFAVVSAGIVFRFDVHRTDLTAVLAGAEVGAGDEVGVVEPESRRAWRKDFPPFAVSGNVWGAFLGGTVNVDGQELAVPVELFGSIGVIVDVYDGLLSFFEAQELTRELPVIDGGG